MNKFSLLAVAFLLAAGLYACKQEEAPTIHIPKTSQTVDPSGGVVDIYLQTNVPNYTVKIDPETADWISPIVSKSGTLSVASFSYTPNPEQSDRKVTLVFSDPENRVSQRVEIVQTTDTYQYPEITSFVFRKQDNPEQLLADISATILDDGTITAIIPYVLADKTLTPYITIKGKTSPVVKADFTVHVAYTVESLSGKKKTYTVQVNSFTGLPSVWIETKDRYINPNKNFYVAGEIKIDPTTLFPKGFTATTRFKGRGNATWGYPKKPYRIKLDTKASIMGMPADKDWVLLAGHCDKSLIRLDLFFELSRILKMEWTPRMEYVELFLNGRYEGNYMMGEHVKTSTDRLNVDEANGGILIEYSPNYYATEPIYFRSQSNKPFTFKTPDPDEITTAQITYSKGVIDDFESRLYSEQFKDPDAGYRAVIDIESFAKWHLTNTISHNLDTNLYYYKKDKNSKLCMGPVWDAEWSFGLGWNKTHAFKPEGWIYQNYFDRLWEDEFFRATVLKLWSDNRTQIKQQILERINARYNNLLLSQEANFTRWTTLNEFVSVGYQALATYNNEIQYVKDFFIKRCNWLDQEMNKQ